MLPVMFEGEHSQWHVLAIAADCGAEDSQALNHTFLKVSTLLVKPGPTMPRTIALLPVVMSHAPVWFGAYTCIFLSAYCRPRVT